MLWDSRLRTGAGHVNVVVSKGDQGVTQLDDPPTTGKLHLCKQGGREGRGGH